VVVLSVPDWSVTPFAEQLGRDRARIAEEVAMFNRANREEAMEAGACYVDITPSSRRAEHDRSLLVEDGLHPSGPMYSEWVTLILPVARRILGSR
jgi:hypothetical protein